MAQQTARVVDITPDVSLFRKVGSQPYRIPDAVAELADNEIDARLPEEKLCVEVTLRMGKTPTIIVQGNGSGMTADSAAKAMKMAYSQKPAELIGEFGLGMKAACSNLGRSFELVTCTSDAPKATRIVYNEDSFLETGVWKIQLEEVDKPFDHGTLITITDLKVNIYAGLKDTMLAAFGRIFRHFVKDGVVEIIVNCEPVVAEEPKLMEGFTKEFSFDVRGHKVHGWYGLLDKSSQTGGYGFELIRHSRAMRRHEKIGFNPHPRLARLTGEIHLDTFPVANNKMDFIRDTDLWREFEDMVGKVTADIRRIASEKASRRLDAKDEARINEVKEQLQEAINSKAFQQTLERRGLDQILTQHEEDEDAVELTKDVEKREPRNGTATGGDGTDHGDTERSRKPRVTHERLRRVKAVLADIEITHDTVAVGPDAPYKSWDVAGISPRVKLSVGTNVDHPMFAEYGEDFVLWVKHNMVEAAAEYLCRESGLQEMLLMKSDILKHIGRMRLEEITAAPALD